MTDTWVVAISALGGAVVGGATSTVGSLVVSRREVVRDAHRELLDDVARFIRGGEWTVGSTIRADQALEDMHRHAVIAGRKDLAAEAEIKELYGSQVFECVPVDMETDEEATARWVRVSDLRNSMLDAADKYRQFLEKRIRRWSG